MKTLILEEYDGFMTPRSVALDKTYVWVRVLKLLDNYLVEHVIKGMCKPMGEIKEVACRFRWRIFASNNQDRCQSKKKSEHAERMMYPDVHFLKGKLVTVGEVWLPRRTLNAMKAHLLLRELLSRSRSNFHYVNILGRPSIPYKLSGSITT
jgi:hypothetical protein